MKQRDPIAVFGLGLITLGIYSWYWAVKTKGEMNKLGEHIPTAWIWLIPIVGGIWWYWQYAQGVEHVTKEKMSGVLAFVVMWLLGMIGQAIIQDAFNKIETAPVAAGQPEPTSESSVPPISPSEPPMQSETLTTSTQPEQTDGSAVPPTPPEITTQ